MWLKWAQQPFRRPNWADYEETFMKRWWEIEESFCSFNSNWEKLWKSLRCHFILPTFFFSVVFHFFFPPFSYFFLLYIYFFFTSSASSVLPPLVFRLSIYPLFFFLLSFCFAPFTFWQKMFAKEDGHARWSGSRDGRWRRREKKQKMNAQVSLWEIRRNAVEWRLLTALAIHKQWQTLEIAAIFRSTCINVYRSFFGPSLFQSIDYFYWVPAKASSA